VGERRGSDFPTVRDQLGREPTTPFTVVARCPGGHPLVIRNEPIDPEGRPFPTLFWLSCPTAVKAVSRLESEGWIARMNARARDDHDFGIGVAAAHEGYARERARGFPQSLAWGGVGGTRKGVKCLHAHYANHLAGGEDPVGSRVAGQIEPIHADERAGRVAAVDLGTNSVRLLVASAGRDAVGGVREIQEFARDMVITRIGQGVQRTGRLEPEALARSSEVLGLYCRRSRALHAGRIRVAATAAVREASNREELEAAAKELAGSELEVVSSAHEAALSFLGGTRGLDAPAPFVVLDIGGGSTEFVVGTRVPEDSVSTSLGSVWLTERLIRSDPPSSKDLVAAESAVDEVLDDVERRLAIGNARTLVAVAGTATTVQGIALGLTFYDPEAIHRTWLPVAEAERVLDRISEMTNEERAALPVMPPGREDVIVAGAVVLVRVMRRFGFDRSLVSETDLLDGLAIEMLDDDPGGERLATR
jgi:exopolyphosphatase/guanosine-5'-triphosphate,3'-diphosphate pyrophosphatase